MLRIPMGGGWENQEKEKSTSMNTDYGQAQKTLEKKKGVRQQTI